MKEIVEINGQFCIFDEMTWGIDKVAYCPICKEKIKKNDTVYLIINNYKLFPNRVMHKSCCKGNFMDTTKQLIELWNKHQDTIKHLDKGWGK